jgi:hypothetical protein
MKEPVLTSGRYQEPTLRILAFRTWYVASLLLGLTSPLYAQQNSVSLHGDSLVPSTLGSAFHPGSVLPLSHFDNHSSNQCDVIFGRNDKGPYSLTWKGILPGSESVLRDGEPLHREADYTIDNAAGTLSLTVPLRPNQILRVTYNVNTVDVAQNKKNVSVPLRWDLWQLGKNHLTLQSVYDPNTPVNNNGIPALFSTLQFGGGMRLLPFSNLSTSLMVDLRGGDWLGRSGMRFGEHTHLRFADLALSYARAGALYALEDTSGFTKGREIMEALGALTPFSGLHIGATLRQTTELPDTGKPGQSSGGSTTRELGGSLALTFPKNRGKVEAARSQVVTTDPKGEGILRQTDTVKVERTLLKSTQVGVTYEALAADSIKSVSSDSKDQGTYAQKTTVDLKSRPNEQVTLAATFRNALGGADSGDTEKLHLEIVPIAHWKRLKLTTNWEDRFQDSGATRSREALIELPPLPIGKTQLSGGVRQFSAPGKELLVGLIDARSQPLRYVDIAGTARLRDGYLNSNTPDTDQVNTYRIKMSLTPLKQLQLTGLLVHNPESDDGMVKRTLSRAFGLESEWGFIKFHGQVGVDEEYLKARLSNTMELGMDVRLTKSDTISTAFQGTSVLDKDKMGTSIYRLGYTRKLATGVDLTLSGIMTRYSLNGADNPDKQELKGEARVGLKF